MKNRNKPHPILSLEMPIYDGVEPVENLLSNVKSRAIHLRLCRKMAEYEPRIYSEAKHWMEIELVLKALITGEYMEQQGIEDVQDGIAQFRTFQRRQLARLLIRCTPLVGFYDDR